MQQDAGFGGRNRAASGCDQGRCSQQQLCCGQPDHHVQQVPENGFCKNGESLVAMDLFTCMGCEADSVTYVAAIKACGGLATEKESSKNLWLEKGIQIHSRVKSSGFGSDIFVGSTLVDMYSKCGSMNLAKEVFDRMPVKNVVTWNSLIMGYVQNGASLEALDLFTTMECEPDAVTYVAVLKACGCLAGAEESSKQLYVQKGINLHKQTKDRGFESDIFVGSTLVDMYSKCGSMNLARQVFDKMRYKNVVTWNALILGYVQNGRSSIAIDLLATMDCEPNSFTYVAALKACGEGGDNEKGSGNRDHLEKLITIHQQVKDRGYDSEVIVANTLVDMYGKCGSMLRAREVFDRMVLKDVVSWNSLMVGYVQNGESLTALNVFTFMDCEPDSLSYVAALKACGSLACASDSEKQFYLNRGIAIHNRARERGLESDILVATTLLDMYSKCRSMQRAKEVFDGMVHKNVVTWNSLLLGYVENGESSVALQFFNCMNCEPDSVTYVAALKACGALANEKGSEKPFILKQGISIHEEVKNRGLDSDIFVANTLVDMYSRCSSMNLARIVFEQMSYKNVVTWNSIIQGYVQNEQRLEAMELFAAMDCKANSLTYVAVLKACGSLAALPAGQQIHAEICKLGVDQDRLVATTLMDFYGRCGSVYTAEELFNNMQQPDAVSWTSLIAGYSSVGDSTQVFRLAKEMQQGGLHMDSITFLCILAACSHAGLVEQGRIYFESMGGYGIDLNVEHYNCMVDLLGRANRLDEALTLIKTMPIESNAVTWMTLLGACRKWDNLEVGKVAFDSLVAAGTRKAAAYVLMSEIYGSSMHQEGKVPDSRT